MGGKYSFFIHDFNMIINDFLKKIIDNKYESLPSYKRINFNIYRSLLDIFLTNFMDILAKYQPKKSFQILI